MPLKFWITVKPHSRVEGLRKISEGEYVCSVHAPARQGQANEAVIARMADQFSVKKSSIKILRGQKGRRKLILIDDT